MQRRNRFTFAMLREPIKEAVLLKNYIDGVMNQEAQFMAVSILGHRR